MTLTRRAVLAGMGGLAVGCRRSVPPLRGAILGGDRAARGHALRGPFVSGGVAVSEAVDVAIVGGGVAGLSAAWRLARAGFRGSVQILELDDRPGGTAQHGVGPLGPFALGAHYLTLPNPEAAHVRAILADLGVITSFDADGRPVYSPAALCLAPEERVFVAGEWIEGLWPESGAEPEDERQLADFLAAAARWRDARGADGRPAFSIPVAHSSRDPAVRALAALPFDAWLDAQGDPSPRLRWWLRYATRDDFGAELSDTSAWAGLHYHCARRPDPSDARDLGTHVLTWPAGNGWLVEGLRARVPWPVTTGAVVLRIEPDGDGARLWVSQDGAVRGVRARAVIAAVPGHVFARLIEGQAPSPVPHAPWRVALLTVDAPPESRGVPVAWDSVPFEGAGLGYVNNAHQAGAYGGPAVLTWYEPLSTLPPAEGRAVLASDSWDEQVERILSDLAPTHPDLRARVQQLDLWAWGHGTAQPIPGLHANGGPLAGLGAPVGAVHRAHTDLSGMSLFEEASWHGVRAAEAVLAQLGEPVGGSLVPDASEGA